MINMMQRKIWNIWKADIRNIDHTWQHKEYERISRFVLLVTERTVTHISQLYKRYERPLTELLSELFLKPQV
jgi:hypothetical protein